MIRYKTKVRIWEERKSEERGDKMSLRGALRRKVSEYRAERKSEKEYYRKHKKDFKLKEIKKKAAQDAKKEVFEGGIIQRALKAKVSKPKVSKPKVKVVYRTKKRRKKTRRARKKSSNPFNQTISWA